MTNFLVRCVELSFTEDVLLCAFNAKLFNITIKTIANNVCCSVSLDKFVAYSETFK